MLAIVVLSLDAMPAATNRLKLGGTVIFLLNSAVVAVEDAVSRPFQERPVCVLRCSDTRSEALSALFVISLFACKYLWCIVNNYERNGCRLGAQKEWRRFAIVVLPVECKMLDSRERGTDDLTAPHDDIVTVMSVSDRFKSRFSGALARKHAEAAGEGRSNATYLHPYLFEAVLPNATLSRVAEHWLYWCFCFVFVATYAVLMGLRSGPHVLLTHVWPAVALLGTALIVCVEMSRYDRKLCRQLLGDFDVAFLLLNVVLYAVFSSVSQWGSKPASLLVVTAIVIVPLWVLGLFGDATPKHDQRFRRLILFLYIANLLRHFAQVGLCCFC
jgi:hypothetical protein